MKHTLARMYRLAASGELPLSDTRWARNILVCVHMGIIVTEQTVRDRLHVRSATLAYWSAVGAIPLLVLAFALTGELGLRQATVDSVRELLYDTVLSEAVGLELVAFVETMLDRVDLTTVGAVGVLGLMAIASQIYFQVELAFNDIFATRLNRSFVWRFVLFNASILVAPVLIAGGVVLAALLPNTGYGFVVPWFMTSAAFTAAIKYLPNTPVRWRSALIGGVTSALMFEAAKGGFGWYTDILGARDNMARLYGSLAFLPVFLIWLNVVWLVILVGVELAYVVDKGSILMDLQRQRAIDPHALRRQPDGLFAVGILVSLYACTKEGSASERQVATVAGVPRHHTSAALDVLEDAGVVTRDPDGRWTPIHAAEDITAGEVLRAWQGLATPQWVNAGVAGALVAQMQLRLEDSANTSMATLSTGATP